MFAPEKVPYAINCYTAEAKRLYGVMDNRLQTSAYLGGRTCSIADIAIFPWVNSWQKQGIEWADYPILKIWFDKIAARPAVQRGCKVLAHLRK